MCVVIEAILTAWCQCWIQVWKLIAHNSFGTSPGTGSAEIDYVRLFPEIGVPPIVNSIVPYAAFGSRLRRWNAARVVVAAFSG